MQRTWLLMILAAAATTTPVLAEDAKPAGDKPAGEKITYDQHILPLLREKCGTCHNGNDKKGDLVLDSYGAAIRGGASGEVIRTDGDVENSTLYRVVAHLSEPFMPPNQPKLPDEQVALIKKWIEGGSLENAGSTSKVKKTSAVARVDVSNQRPAGPPPMPENLSIDPLLVTSRGNGVTALAVNPWSPLAAVSGHRQILLFNTSNLELVGVLPFPEGQPHVLKFSRNGQLLLAGGGRGAHSGKVILFDVKTGNRVATVGDEYDVVLAADVSPDQTLVVLGGPKKIVRCYSVATGELQYELKKHTDWITTLEFSPDGVLLATGDRSNGLIVWEGETGREFYTLNGHTAAITDVSWGPDSNILASSSEDGNVRLWEMQNGNGIKNWGAHGGGSLSVDFSRDGRIATAGRDLRGKLWDGAGNAQKTYEPALPDLGTAVAVCAETDRVLVGDLTGVVHVYSAKDGVKVGELSTNPPALATRIQQTQAAVTQADTASMAAAAQVAALQKGIADRKAVAEVAMKALAEAQAGVEVATKAKAAVDADVATKSQAVATTLVTLTAADTAKTASTAAQEAAAKAAANAASVVKTATDAVAAAEVAHKQAVQASADKPDDAELKSAVTTAAKKLEESQASLVDANKKRADADQTLVGASDDLKAKTATQTTAKAGHDAAVAAKGTADKLAAEAAAKLQMAQTLVAAKKVEADKATAAAQVTPEQQKQLADAEAAAKGAADQLAALKDRLARLTAAQGRPAQTAAAN